MPMSLAALVTMTQRGRQPQQRSSRGEWTNGCGASTQISSPRLAWKAVPTPTTALIYAEDGMLRGTS